MTRTVGAALGFLLIVAFFATITIQKAGATSSSPAAQTSTR
jgi:hypothetical protein